MNGSAAVHGRRWATFVPAGALLVFLFLFGGCGQKRAPEDSIRLGFFPNITHAQALVGKKDGTFQKHCGGKVEMKAFNAGPAAMEALLGDSIDLTYVGGGPALTAFVRSEGRAHVLAGSATGGSVLVVSEGIQSLEDLNGNRVATPQLGNSQDIALRHHLREHGLEDAMLGERGVQVLPLANPDALAQFRKGQIVGAWVPEPWGARMIHEGKGHILIDERDLWPNGEFPTTVLVATERALNEKRPLVDCVMKAHEELTVRWEADPKAFAAKTNESFAEMTKHPLPQHVLDDAFSRLRPTLSPMASQLAEMARHSKKLGYLPSDKTDGLVAPRP